ncbi:hypothetical protein GCM10023259_080130 [Thermocatellispora tengchongensis]
MILTPHAVPVPAPAGHPGLHVVRLPGRKDSTDELVQIRSGEALRGVLAMPAREARELAARLQYAPPTREDITPRILAEVLWYYDHATGTKPDAFHAALIDLLVIATDTQRAYLAGPHYAGYAAAVAIALSDGGLEHLRGMYEALMADTMHDSGDTE